MVNERGDSIVADQDMTGEQLFLRYAFPCAEGRLIRGKITEQQMKQLKVLIENDVEPKRQFLRYCFPHAYRRLREFAQKNNIDHKRWEYDTISNFWRYHHEHQGDCRVYHGMIVSKKEKIVTVMNSDPPYMPIIAINYYDLPACTGDTAYVHLRMVTEIEKNTALS